jgi:hypothetical protein
MGAEAPRFVLLEGTNGLDGPRGPGRSGGLEAPAPRGPCALTGGGLAVLVDPVRGLLGVWQGEERVAGPLTLRSGEAVVPLGAPDGDLGSDPGLRIGPGSWGRSFPLPEGGVVEERGLVPDVEGAVVIQWTLRRGPAAPPLTGSLALPDGTPLPLPSLDLGTGAPRTVFLLPPGADADGARRRLAPLRARELARRRRGAPDDGAGFTLDEEGDRALHLTRALALLDDAPLGLDEDGRPRGPFLAGVEGAGATGTPVFLGGAALAEVGLGALLAGRHDLARAALETLAREPDPPPPLHLLFLAARWALWTGRPGELLPLEGTLEAAVEPLIEAIGAGPGEGIPESAPSGSAFPSPARTLEILADGLEPLGDARWGEGLRERVRNARAARSGSGSGVSGRSAGLPLPVLGQAATPTEVHDEHGSTTLPPPEAFGRPDLPGQRHASTLRAARILRSWVEGVLGAEADAAYGRLTLAPRIGRDVGRLAVAGLRLGDASVSLDCRRQGPSCTFLLRQDRGRVPVNLIFAPRLPMAGVSEVRIGDEAGEVEVKNEPDGVVVRCQFPLDPERRITIVGSD